MHAVQDAKRDSRPALSRTALVSELRAKKVCLLRCTPLHFPMRLLPVAAALPSWCGWALATLIILPWCSGRLIVCSAAPAQHNMEDRHLSVESIDKL